MGAGNNEKTYFGWISTKLFPPFIFYFGSQKKKSAKKNQNQKTQPNQETLLFSLVH